MEFFTPLVKISITFNVLWKWRINFHFSLWFLLSTWILQSCLSYILLSFSYFHRTSFPPKFLHIAHVFLLVYLCLLQVIHILLEVQCPKQGTDFTEFMLNITIAHVCTTDASCLCVTTWYFIYSFIYLQQWWCLTLYF